ncbi:hypothetical protein EMIHUDRAFT_451855, partial [Emiliania huxleyi CCMP1516]|uniref:Uncharacterized protein n=2 Tax=Emiliania huxleyi TaxID=2903 RepID=A0A0D3IS57_EMIH1
MCAMYCVLAIVTCGYNQTTLFTTASYQRGIGVKKFLKAIFAQDKTKDNNKRPGPKKQFPEEFLERLSPAPCPPAKRWPISHKHRRLRRTRRLHGVLADVMHLAASLRLAKHDLLDFLDECCLGALLPGSEQERLVAEPCLGEGGALYPRPMEEYRSLMPPRVLSRLCDLVTAARAAGAVSLGVVVLWSRWCRTSPTDAHYGALDEYFGPWGVASHDNPLYLASDKGRAIMHELAPPRGRASSTRTPSTPSRRGGQTGAPCCGQNSTRTASTRSCWRAAGQSRASSPPRSGRWQRTSTWRWRPTPSSRARTPGRRRCAFSACTAAWFAPQRCRRICETLPRLGLWRRLTRRQSSGRQRCQWRWRSLCLLPALRPRDLVFSCSPRTCHLFLYSTAS